MSDADATHKTGGVTFRAGDVVVPLYDGTGALVNLQLINAGAQTHPERRSKGAVTPSKGKTGRKTPVDSGGLCDGAYRASPDRETVMVALSSVNLLSLASLARQKHPACQIVLAADRDLNGDGQTKAAAAADACGHGCPAAGVR
jgi:putative DNA primase/helicase